VESVDTEQHNIAGVDNPIYVTTRFKLKSYDLFNESPWIDDAIKAVCDLIEIRKERDVLLEQYRRINRELRVTTQRVNLFEKIKIPESKENIRVIQIYLGDQQTSAVGKSKIAKKKLAEVAND
jgi:V/A-type H+-transporting ATPase subunit D